jgi:hypothetical protein
VESVVPESESAKSFRLVPADSGPLDLYYPGQHLRLRLTIPGQPRPLFRCYTISNYGDNFYRLTIKKELAPANRSEIASGLSSTYFHDVIRPGDILEAMQPSGNFWLDLRKEHPVVMLAGGIGVTPMMSMLEGLARTGSRRDVYFFFALRHDGDDVFQMRLNALAEQCPNLHMRVFYGELRSEDAERRQHHQIGRLSIAALRKNLPSLALEYYLCGPPGMMKTLSEALNEAGVAPDKIRTESFGPSSTNLRMSISTDEKAEAALRESELAVTFARSGIRVLWTGEARTLLHLAELNRVDIISGCQYGDCGTCMTRLIDGRVKYLHATGARPDRGYCLPCSCRPETEVILDA